MSKQYRIKSTPLIQSQGMMRYIAQIAREGNKTKAHELYACMGLPDEIAEDLVSDSPRYQVKDEAGTENVIVSPIT